MGRLVTVWLAAIVCSLLGPLFPKGMVKAPDWHPPPPGSLQALWWKILQFLGDPQQISSGRGIGVHMQSAPPAVKLGKNIFPFHMGVLEG